MAETERVPSGTARCCTEQVEKTSYEHSNGCGVKLIEITWALEMTARSASRAPLWPWKGPTCRGNGGNACKRFAQNTLSSETWLPLQSQAADPTEGKIRVLTLHIHCWLMKPLQESVTSPENEIYKQINEQICAPFIDVAALMDFEGISNKTNVKEWCMASRVTLFKCHHQN